MGITDKHTVMEEAANWPAEVHFHKISHRRTRKSQSPSREVSPVPSYFSEPVSIRTRKDVTGRLPRLIKVAHQDEDDDDDDIQSLKSLPTVMNTSASDPKVNRSQTVRKGQGISDSGLPLLLTSKCTLVVKGTGCTRTGGVLPAISPTVLKRPPCRAGCRPDKVELDSTQYLRLVGNPQHASVNESRTPEKTWNRKASQHLPSSSFTKVSLGPRITFQSPMVQGVYPITPDLMKDSRHNAQACQPLRPVLKKAQELNRRALHSLLEESYLPCSRNTHLLEPFSGFEKHLCHQLLHSPLPSLTVPLHVNSHHPLELETMLPVLQELGSSRMQRTVELCNPQQKQLPSITMTCPTPSPKHLHNVENRHVA